MSGLIGLIEDGALDPAHIAAILVKTEGNGGVNNFTREYTCATTPSSPRSSARSPWWCLAAARMRYITVKCASCHRYSWTKKKRSPFVSWTRLRTFRRNMIS